MQEQNYSIKDWAKDDQPREKLLSRGAENLSNSELIAILIKNGMPQRSALQLAREVLNLSKNNLSELGKISVKEMMKVKGIGEAKAITIVAALELGRRRHAGSHLEKQVVASSRDLALFLQPMLKDYNHEVFAVIFLNRGNRVIHFEIISHGGLTATVADPRIILKKALEYEAVNIVLCHNHPSGSLRPSRADEDITNKIKEASFFLDIRLLDHLIVSDEGYFSFADEGLI